MTRIKTKDILKTVVKKTQRRKSLGKKKKFNIILFVEEEETDFNLVTCLKV